MFTNKKVDYSVLGDKIIFEDLILGFAVDENLATIKELFEWIKESTAKGSPVFSDMTINVLTNNSQPNIQYKIYNAFPYLVGSVLLDVASPDLEVPTNDVYFKFSHFDIFTPS